MVVYYTFNESWSLCPSLIYGMKTNEVSIWNEELFSTKDIFHYFFFGAKLSQLCLILLSWLHVIQGND